jgi:dienelactone hydrolase
MRALSFFSILLLASTLTPGRQVETKSAGEFQTLARLFDYDAKQPLDIHDEVVEETSDAVIHDITYASPKGGPVAAYLVVPKRKGPFAAVLFGHWGNGTRSEFIPEAKLYARAGAVSLLPDYPWDRKEPWRKTLYHFDNPERDREAYVQAVVDLRRGIDLLLARPEVDGKRLAYVGHSFGAQWGSILSAVDKRMKATVLMAGVAETADILQRNDDPDLVGLRKGQPAGQLEKYLGSIGEFDAIHVIGRAAPVSLLLQFARYEQYFDKTSETHYADAASNPKKVLSYDAGHDLNDPCALQDRLEWLAARIGLQRSNVVSGCNP